MFPFPSPYHFDLRPLSPSRVEYLTPSSRHPNHGSMNMSRWSRIVSANVTDYPSQFPHLVFWISSTYVRIYHFWICRIQKMVSVLCSFHARLCIRSPPDHRFHFLYKCSISILWCLRWVWSEAAIVLTGTLASSADHPRGSEQCQQGWLRAQAKPHRRCFVANIVYSSRRE